jgi:hypothetical protein
MSRRFLGVILLAMQALTAGAATAAQDAPARSPLGAAEKRLVSLDVQGVTARELSRQLSDLAGVQVVYIPAKGSDKISLQVQSLTLGKLISDLAKQGGIAIAGRDFVPAPAAGFDKNMR